MTELDTTDFTGALKALRKRQSELRNELVKIEAGIEALLSLGDASPATHPFPPRLLLPPYKGKTLVAAAADVLAAEEQGMATGALWQKMKDRGAESESANPVNSLYTSLSKNKRFYRENKVWKLEARRNQT